ncbi:MAG: murein transglycosylase A [Gallionellaceae bacterium]
MNKQQNLWLVLFAASFALAACKTAPVKRPATTSVPPVTVTAPTPLFSPSTWEMLPDWSTMDLSPSWAAMLQSCRVLKSKPRWLDICNSAEQIDKNDSEAQRKFYEERLVPFQVFNPDGSDNGVITGYYEPLLHGSRYKTARFRYPLYAAPDDMLDIDLSDAYPQLKGMRLRGRLQGKKVLPYYKRAEIDLGTESLKGRELFWVENAVELFFLQIQGSGRIELPDGTQVKVGYAEQNGYPYVSIGRKLIEMGEMKLENASMQGIKAWGEKNPDKLTTLLEMNPSYVFFRELPENLSAPLGALGVPLTNEYSIAVDPKSIPLGAPVFLATTQPNTTIPLNRLMLAQDTGGAIRGPVRADFFWGFGEKAASQAGRMKQQGRMWVLFPKGGEPVQY